MSNSWKVFLQLKESLAKLTSDKSVQNLFSKEKYTFLHKGEGTNLVVARTNLNEDHKTKETSSSTKEYDIPKAIQGFRDKISKGGTPEVKTEVVPGWKVQPRISKTSIQSRTNHIIISILNAETEVSLITRIETLINHVKQYPEARIVTVKENAISVLLWVQSRNKSSQIDGPVREALAILGYSPPVKGRGLRVLSIDGGGIRGILVLEMLKKLEELSGKRVHELFDLICGVSTGSILALSLGVHQRTVDDVLDAYVTISKEVFKQSALWGTGNLMWSQSYYNTALWEKKLQEHLGKESLISTARNPLSPKVCVVSAVVNHQTISAYLFRNYNLPWKIQSQYFGGCKHEIWEAVRASASAPTYFEEFKIGNFLHQDGGILVNNPTAIALHEARLLWPGSPIQCVVSFGTGRTVSNLTELEKESTSENTSWANKFLRILDSATDTEGVHIMLNDLLPGVYFRFNPYLTEMVSMVELDDKKIEQLKRDAIMYLRRNEEKFENAAKMLTQEKTVTQKTKDWIYTKREIYRI